MLELFDVPLPLPSIDGREYDSFERNLGDDFSHLVFADWLEERGDFRSELLRATILYRKKGIRYDDLIVKCIDRGLRRPPPTRTSDIWWPGEKITRYNLHRYNYRWYGVWRTSTGAIIYLPDIADSHLDAIIKIFSKQDNHPDVHAERRRRDQIRASSLSTHNA